MTGFEIGALFLGKLLIGKAVTWAGGHALATAGTSAIGHLGMHAAINTTASTLAAGTVAGGAVAACHGLWSSASFANEVETRRKKNALEKAGALGTVKGLMKEQLIAMVFQVLEEMYKNCEIKDAAQNKARVDSDLQERGLRLSRFLPL